MTSSKVMVLLPGTHREIWLTATSKLMITDSLVGAKDSSRIDVLITSILAWLSVQRNGHLAGTIFRGLQ
eukprot:3915938-Amphidinium_carterae.1